MSSTNPSPSSTNPSPSCTNPSPSSQKIGVWWDYDNCGFPKSEDAGLIVNNITRALRELNLCGPVTFSAYGDVKTIPGKVLSAMNSTGLTMINVPGGEKNATDLRMLLDMTLWAVQNPPPATYMSISGDQDFSPCLYKLRGLGYNIVLACLEVSCSSHLVNAAEHVLSWTNLCMGKITEFAGGATAFAMDNRSPIATKDEEFIFGSLEPLKGTENQEEL